MQRRPFEALQHRDYRLYWIGSFVSMLGSQMTAVANAWEVYRLTHNPLMLGMTGLFSLATLVLFSLYGGVVADVLDRRRLMILTQALMMVSSAVLAAMTLTGHISVWLIYGMAAVNGAAMAFNNPARSALVANLVPREHLANAISLGTMNRQVATVIGPSAAGIIIGEAQSFSGVNGIGIAYAVDAVSFTAVLVALMMMRVRFKAAQASQISLSSALQGLRFVFSNPLLRSTMLLDFFATFSGSSESLMPIFAADYLHAGPQGLGFLMAAPSIGAVISAVLLSAGPQIRRQGAGVLWGVAVYGLAWVGFGLAHTFWVGWFALAVTGAADTVNMVMRQTINQIVTPDELRGRMTSVNMIFFMGGPRLGEFESGAVARFFTAPVSALTGGAGVVLIAAIIAITVPALRNYVPESGPEPPTRG